MVSAATDLLLREGWSKVAAIRREIGKSRKTYGDVVLPTDLDDEDDLGQVAAVVEELLGPSARSSKAPWWSFVDGVAGGVGLAEVRDELRAELAVLGDQFAISESLSMDSYSPSRRPWKPSWSWMAFLRVGLGRRGEHGLDLGLDVVGILVRAQRLRATRVMVTLREGPPAAGSSSKVSWVST